MSGAAELLWPAMVPTASVRATPASGTGGHDPADERVHGFSFVDCLVPTQSAYRHGRFRPPTTRVTQTGEQTAPQVSAGTAADADRARQRRRAGT